MFQLQKLIDSLKIQLQILQLQLKIMLLNQQLSRRQKLYTTAKENIGKDLSPTQSTLGCAEVVNQIHKIAFGNEIGGGASTYNLWQELKTRKDFIKIPDYEIGAVIISPTGTQPANSRLIHGHAGVCGANCIMSNNSLTGLLDTIWNKDSWTQSFKNYGGFPIYYFRKI